MQADGVQRPVGILDARLDDVQRHLADPLAEQGADAVADEADQPLEHTALDQAQLDPLCHASGQRPVQPQPPMQEARDLHRPPAADLGARDLAIGLHAAVLAARRAASLVRLSSSQPAEREIAPSAISSV